MIFKLQSPSGFLLLAALSCALFVAECSSESPVVDKDFTCPTGFIPMTDIPPYTTPRCRANPCYGNPGPCGANNQCEFKVTGISGLFFVETVCTCPAPSVVSHIVYTDFCYVPGTDRCNPNPCKNGGTCTAVTDFNNVKGAFQCACPDNFQGTTCELPAPAPQPTAKSGGGGPTVPPVPPTGNQGQCGQPGAAADFPNRCWFNNDPQGRYVCCDNQGCNGFNADNLTPHCKNNGYVPLNFGVTGPVTPPPTGSPGTQPNQGLCGTGSAGPFPTRCWFNNDPQGRYVCCDNQGCDGFNADNLTPHCKNYGYVPPNFGVTGPIVVPASPAPTGDQGVCGKGVASAFPVRCWYNNDPQGRYVCCDNDGCDGFNPPGNFFPHCKSNGYVPQNL